MILMNGICQWKNVYAKNVKNLNMLIFGNINTLINQKLVVVQSVDVVMNTGKLLMNRGLCECTSCTNEALKLCDVKYVNLLSVEYVKIPDIPEYVGIVEEE